MFLPVPRTTFDLRRPARCLARGRPCVTASRTRGPRSPPQRHGPGFLSMMCWSLCVRTPRPSVPARPLPTPSRRGPRCPAPSPSRWHGERQAVPGSAPCPGHLSVTGGGDSAHSRHPTGGRFSFSSGVQTRQPWERSHDTSSSAMTSLGLTNAHFFSIVLRTRNTRSALGTRFQRPYSALAVDATRNGGSSMCSPGIGANVLKASVLQ